MTDLEMIESHGPDFDEFYSLHYQRIASALSFAVGDSVLGQEATDEAMTRAVARWHQLRNTSNPPGWVYRVGLNWANSSRGKTSRLMKRLVSRSGPARQMQLPADINPDLWAAVSSLEADLRSVLVCRMVADWSTKETAEVLNLAEGTVKTRLARALREMRAELDDTELEDHTPMTQEA